MLTHITSHRIWLVIAGVITTVICGLSHAQSDYRYAVFPLPTLGGEHSYGWGMGGPGIAVGNSSIPGGGFLAAVWIEGGEPISLGSFGGRYSQAEDMNSTGEVVGWATYEGGGSFDARAFLWRNGEMIDLGTFGGDWAEAEAINEVGQVVGYARSPDDKAWAFIWEDGEMRHLEGLHPTRNHQAYGINNNGIVVGYAWDASEFGLKHAVLWHEDGSVRDLGTLRPSNEGQSEAFDINDAGYVVGGADVTSSNRNAFVWIDGQMYDLGRLPNKSDANALAINNQNQIVGYSTRGYPNNDAFLWEQGRGMQRLDEIIAPNARWRLSIAWGINDAGHICGNGHRLGNSGTSVGFLLTPVNPTLQLNGPAPGQAGEANILTVSNCTPGARVAFLYSRQGGGQRIPGCDLQQNAIQLDSPTVIGTAVADGNGVATITRTVPPIARGQTILFQALVQNECAISPLVVHTFE
ncbi:MAG: DUF3466 family protein [Phycisphaerales bacterium]|nr:DUF3466 family protein [Phycisphaerales bacterium]